MKPAGRVILSIYSSMLLCAISAWAGPPFITDDPEPVELHHIEFYIASIYNNSGNVTTGTAPHIEFNYGAARQTQVHVIAPLAYAELPGMPRHYGIGDVELGVKYRFLPETICCPQAGIFPLVELPSGDASAGLGSGHASAFLPVWLQKSFGPWTTYGGGGYWFNKTAAGDNDYWQAGLQLQRDFSKLLTAGAEIFSYTQKAEGGTCETGLNAGLILNFTDEHHLLLSAGGDTNGPNQHFAYAAFQWTTGSGQAHQ